MALTYDGINLTVPLIILALAFIIIIVSTLYNRGDLKMPEFVSNIIGNKEDDGDDSDDQEVIENQGDIDIKFIDTDTEQIYDFVGFTPEWIDPQNARNFKGTYELDNGSKRNPTIDATSEQISPVYNLDLLKGKTLILRFSRKGRQGILDKENKDIRDELYDAHLEISSLKDRLKDKSKDIDEQIKKEQESRRAHRKSLYPTGGEYETQNDKRKKESDNDDLDE